MCKGLPEKRIYFTFAEPDANGFVACAPPPRVSIRAIADPVRDTASYEY